MTFEINPNKLAQLDSLQLDRGRSDSWEQGHCALEVVAWLVDDTHTDQPVCVDPYIAGFVRHWNDGISGAERRTEMLRPLLPLLVGTRSSDALTLRRMWTAIDWDIRTRAPAFLRLAGLDEVADRIQSLPEITSQDVLNVARATLQDAQRLATTAWAAEWDAARAAEWDAALDAAWASAGAAARAAATATAWNVARDATWAAARAATLDAAGVAAWDVARDNAWDRLRPTVEAMQASAQDLVRRMCELKEEAT